MLFDEWWDKQLTGTALLPQENETTVDYAKRVAFQAWRDAGGKVYATRGRPRGSRKSTPSESVVDSVLARKMYVEDGFTLAAIGRHFGVSREWIRQKLVSLGITIKDSAYRKNIRLQVEEGRKRREKQRETRIYKRYGCNSATYDCIPTEARQQFKQQRRMAEHRGIAWDISLATWWGIWEQSSLWTSRGRGANRYVLARIDMNGPFTVENVHIITLKESSHDGIHAMFTRHGIEKGSATSGS